MVLRWCFLVIMQRIKLRPVVEDFTAVQGWVGDTFTLQGIVVGSFKVWSHVADAVTLAVRDDSLGGIRHAEMAVKHPASQSQHVCMQSRGSYFRTSSPCG